LRLVGEDDAGRWGDRRRQRGAERGRRRRRIGRRDGEWGAALQRRAESRCPRLGDHAADGRDQGVRRHDHRGEELMSRVTIAAIEAEYRRYKAYADGAMAQLSGEQLNARPGDVSNSVAMIVWHVSGNLASRFTDFLTTDGEKSWRVREEEFAARMVSKPD